ncbi:bacteriorhodopsin [Solwaraspora sp. WMMD937]|uniref:bacteriorhodopsin n=1 Tax=Solwaraspora sp. WMMD937 TaxID=3016090 RepID=UPI00249C90DD|nr:bacteriorhodopsin [Solwaraspora sp. WMMD937]WFE23472.1 bacteriorhodopsin [Solwaraspora sp. WMMD937]
MVSQLWLWSFVVVALGAVLYFVRWMREPKGVPVAVYLLAIVILIWSAIWHAVMALGGALTTVGDHAVHWGYYADWIVTAPLLGYALVLVGTHASAGRRTDLVALVVVTSVPMIFCGLVGDLALEPTTRYLAYGVGVLALGANYVVIWGPLRRAAAQQPDHMRTHFDQLAVLLSALWLGFTLVWLVGPAGLGVFDEPTTTAVFVVLTVLMKIVWSALDLGRLRLFANRDALHVVH